MNNPHVCTDCGQRFPVASVAAFHCGKYQPPEKRTSDNRTTSAQR